MSTRTYVSRGLWFQLRSQHWLVKLIMLCAGLLLGGPFVGAAVFVLFNAAGPLALFAAVIGVIVFGAWFLQPPSELVAREGTAGSVDGPVEARRYCEECGTSYSSLLASCPDCDAAWTVARPADSPGFLASVLNDITSQYQLGRLARPSTIPSSSSMRAGLRRQAGIRRRRLRGTSSPGCPPCGPRSGHSHHNADARSAATGSGTSGPRLAAISPRCPPPDGTTAQASPDRDRRGPHCDWLGG
jgi:hypothetical protein